MFLLLFELRFSILHVNQLMFNLRNLDMGIMRETLFDELEKLNVRAAKIIFGFGWNTSGKDVINKAKWSTLNDMHKQQLVYLAYKCYHELSPPTLQSIFSKNVHRYQLRNKMTYKLPKPNKDFLKKSISFQAASLWSGLSLELKISRTFKEFKKSVYLKRLRGNLHYHRATGGT